MAIRVIVADDHNVVRKGIRDLLSDEDDIAVVGEARNGKLYRFCSPACRDQFLAQPAQYVAPT